MFQFIVSLTGVIGNLSADDFSKVGYGTYPLRGEACTDALEIAIRAGYRIIDTATYYRNFDGIAAALKNQDRSQFYLISKVWHDEQTPEALRKDLEATLKALKTDYLDAYLLHWPNSNQPIEETLSEMNEQRLRKKVRHIGLSNVNINHVKRALEVGVPITWVQVEMHPLFCDFELLQFCQKHSIGVQAWAPLGRGRISKDPELAKIGKKYGKSAAQVSMRWIVQHGCIPLPGSDNEKHISENIAIDDFTLTDNEMAVIDKRAKEGTRERYSKEVIGFQDEFDFSFEECWPKAKEIIVTNDFSVIEQEAAKLNDKSLILFDVDGTLIVPVDAILQFQAGEKFKELVSVHADLDLFRDIRVHASHVLVDDRCMSLIPNLQEKKIPVIAFTAAPSVVRGGGEPGVWRVEELRKHGFEFGFSFSTQLMEFPKLKNQQFYPLYREGVLYSSFQKKGPILIQFLQQLGFRPEKIIFVDDELPQVQSVVACLKDLGIPCVGIHYTTAHEIPCDLNLEWAEFQIRHFVQHGIWLGDSQQKH